MGVITKTLSIMYKGFTFVKFAATGKPVPYVLFSFIQLKLGRAGQGRAGPSSIPVLVAHQRSKGKGFVATAKSAQQHGLIYKSLFNQTL